MHRSLQTAVIGAGIAGIASAIRLAARGHAVTVFETNTYPGGKLSQFEQEGYRFDAGPSLFTMPHYVDELFRLAGETPDVHFRYEQLPVGCHYFWEDGAFLRAWTDPAQLAAEVEAQLGVPGRRVTDYLHKSRRKYEAAGRIFLEKSLHRVDTWWRRDVLQALFQLPGFDLLSSMHEVHVRQFEHPKLVQLFNRYATYNGSNPYKAPGMLTIIPHFEYNIGVFYPRGGMYRITQSLFELSQRMGVQYRFQTPVERIVTGGGGVQGVVVNGMTERFDRIVSNMDVYYTYKRLLPDQPHPERILRQPKSTSALIFYWGVRHKFPQLHLHNIFFADDYRREFETLEQGNMADDITVYINITSKYTPEDAPPGCENWFVMVNAPSDAGQDWPTLIARVRAQVIEKISRRLGTDLTPLIACESILEPREIERKTSSHLGALYGYSSNNRMAAFLRHPNFSSHLKGLYFVGGSVHPGGGIPLCLLSAKIMDDAMQQGFQTRHYNH